jgi:hypothetical protein
MQCLAVRWKNYERKFTRRHSSTILSYLQRRANEQTISLTQKALSAAQQLSHARAITTFDSVSCGIIILFCSIIDGLSDDVNLFLTHLDFWCCGGRWTIQLPAFHPPAPVITPSAASSGLNPARFQHRLPTKLMLTLLVLTEVYYCVCGRNRQMRGL